MQAAPEPSEGIAQPLDSTWSAPVPLVAPRLGVLWRPNLIVFVSSACTMVLELVAGRIIAPYVGVSLYTWTSVIGVVLAGISARQLPGRAPGRPLGLAAAAGR